MLITIIRHCQSLGNITDTLQGHLGGELTEQGRVQARQLGIALKGSGIDLCVTTDLQRGLDTAKAIMEWHDAPMIRDSLLRERSFGVFDGSNRSKFFEYERSLRDPYSNKPLNGESLQDVYARSQIFLKKLVKQYAAERILVVSHSDFIKMMLGVLQNLTVAEAIQIQQDNGSINILEFYAPGIYKVLELNSVKHLF